MEKLEEIFKSLVVLRQVDFDGGSPMIITIDTSPIGQNDTKHKRFAIRFGARIPTWFKVL